MRVLGAPSWDVGAVRAALPHACSCTLRRGVVRCGRRALPLARPAWPVGRCSCLSAAGFMPGGCCCCCWYQSCLAFGWRLCVRKASACGHDDEDDVVRHCWQLRSCGRTRAVAKGPACRCLFEGGTRLLPVSPRTCKLRLNKTHNLGCLRRQCDVTATNALPRCLLVRNEADAAKPQPVLFL